MISVLDFQTVRVQGNAISHSLSLSKVKKEDEGVYECRVSDLWADESQEFNVHATLHVTLADSMVAEEAVSHIQNRGSLRNTITALGGASSWRATSEPRKNFAGGQMPGLGKQRVSQESQLGLLSYPPPQWPGHQLHPCQETQASSGSSMGLVSECWRWVEMKQSYSDPQVFYNLRLNGAVYLRLRLLVCFELHLS